MCSFAATPRLSRTSSRGVGSLRYKMQRFAEPSWPRPHPFMSDLVTSRQRDDLVAVKAKRHPAANWLDQSKMPKADVAAFCRLGAGSQPRAKFTGGGF